MRAIVLGLAAVLATSSVSAQTYVHGYTTKSGTYVAPHYRSSPDATTSNNWSVKPNVNPYTGQAGTKNPYGSTYSNPYAAPKPSYSCTYCSTSPSQSSSGDDGDPQ